MTFKYLTSTGISENVPEQLLSSSLSCISNEVRGNRWSGGEKKKHQATAMLSNDRNKAARCHCKGMGVLKCSNRPAGNYCITSLPGFTVTVFIKSVLFILMSTPRMDAARREEGADMIKFNYTY